MIMSCTNPIECEKPYIGEFSGWWTKERERQRSNKWRNGLWVKDNVKTYEEKYYCDYCVSLGNESDRHLVGKLRTYMDCYVIKIQIVWFGRGLPPLTFTFFFYSDHYRGTPKYCCKVYPHSQTKYFSTQQSLKCFISLKMQIYTSKIN